MTRTNLTMGAAIIAILAGVGVAQARDHGTAQRGFQMDFAALDVDGNGEIEASDIEALRAQRFAEIDTDGNGTVSEAEFVAHATARAGERASQMFARLDSDGDGSLSRDVIEMRGKGPNFERLLSRADTDDSGGLSEAEFDALKERFAERRENGKRRGHGRP